MTRYAYDDVGRVATVTNALGKTMAYSYDEVGNVTEFEDYAGNVTTYSYDDMDRLVEKKVGTEKTTYIYDDKGQLTKVTDKSGDISYGYDKYGRLTSQTDAKGVTISYTYDKAGRLETFNNGFGTTSYEYDLLDRVTRVVDRNGKATVYEYDELGNRSAVRYPNGNVVTYTYDAYGNLLEKEGDSKNEFLYTGEQYNANTGLYYLRARYMNPSTGTFISMDSYQGSIYDPVTLHKYLYANANPVMYTDPSGYSSTLKENMTCLTISTIIASSFILANQVALNIFSGLRQNMSDALLSDVVWATQRDWQSVILTFPSHNYDKSWIISVPAALLSWKLFEAIYATEEDTSWIPGVPAEEQDGTKIIQNNQNENLEISEKSKEIWGKGTFDSVEDSLEYHYKEHGKEVGAESIDQYVRKAEGFSQNLRGAKKSYPQEGTPGSVRYTKNGKYIIIGPDGKILSYGLAR